MWRTKLTKWQNKNKFVICASLVYSLDSSFRVKTKSNNLTCTQQSSTRFYSLTALTIGYVGIGEMF